MERLRFIMIALSVYEKERVPYWREIVGKEQFHRCHIKAACPLKIAGLSVAAFEIGSPVLLPQSSQNMLYYSVQG